MSRREAHQAKPRQESNTPGSQVVSLTARIEMLSYQTSFDIEKGTGNVPVSVSLFPQSGFQTALESMRKVFKSSLCFSDLVAVAKQGARLGGIVVPKAMVGLATVSSILVKAVLLKAGIPMVAKFEGILQIKNRRPARFVDLIEYTGSSLDPAEIFIAGKMTRVSPAVKKGNGSVLASFWELPGLARPEVELAIDRLKSWGVKGLVVLGRMSEPVCEMPVMAYRIGVILPDGLNPVAAAVESGIEAINHPMSGLINVSRLKSLDELVGG